MNFLIMRPLVLELEGQQICCSIVYFMTKRVLISDDYKKVSFKFYKHFFADFDLSIFSPALNWSKCRIFFDDQSLLLVLLGLVVIDLVQV